MLPMSHPHHRRRRRQFHRRTDPGAPPGTLLIDPAAQTPRVRVIAYRGDQLHEQELKSLDTLPSIVAAHRVTWVNVDGLGDATVLRRIADIFHLHRLAMEDVVNLHQRAKVEHYNGHLFIVARMPHAPCTAETEQVAMFVGSNFVVTFTEDPGDSFDPVRQRLRDEGSLVRQAGTDHLAYALLDAVIDHFFPLLEHYGEQLDEIEDQVLDQPSAPTLRKIHTLKRDLLALRRAIWPHREALSILAREHSPLITAETQVYLRDCYDHIVQIMDLLETYRDLSSDLRDAYLSAVSNRMNDVMRVLTVISTLFIPLTFITSVYGMNFDPDAGPLNMPELRWPLGYVMVWGVNFAVSAAMLFFFWRRGWLRSFYPREVLNSPSRANDCPAPDRAPSPRQPAS